ncbi:hypothetical protein CRG98_037995 [Punica granatum]|nr:hypothetical protein CRG98_037995 [Punica granatum]
MAHQSLSLTSHRELTSSKLELDPEVVRGLLQSQRDKCDQDLFGLIEDYFETSNQTSNFFVALDKCLARARDSRLILMNAVSYFEEEAEREKKNGLDLEGIKYANTLRELEKFKTAGDPFGGEFSGLLQSVSDRQSGLQKQLRERKERVAKKLKSAETGRRASNVLFVAAFVSALILSVVAAAVGAQPVITALAGVLIMPIDSVGKWVNSLWKKRQKELKWESELLGLMEAFTFLDVEIIRVVVDNLENRIKYLMQNAELALGRDAAVRPAVGKIERETEWFTKTVEELDQRNHKWSQEIRIFLTFLLQKLIFKSNDD